MFSLGRNGRFLHATGMLRCPEPGTADTVEARVRAFFDLHGQENGDGPPLLVGALPFERERQDLLFQPKAAEWSAHWPAPTGRTPTGLRVEHGSSAADYARAVASALDLIADGELEKVVLSRRLSVSSPSAVDPAALLARLAQDPAVTAFLFDLSVATGKAHNYFVGATPEMLVTREGPMVRSHPLAGSAARSSEPVEDRRRAADLLASAKDQAEHALVVEAILDTLAPLCERLSTPEGVTLRSTATMWHLGTRIEGVLKDGDGPSAAGLAALLHPTPAVGGYPREAALAAIKHLEAEPRGFYAGAVGWTDARGDGEFHVALRCAEICGSRLELHAGAGIVEGSKPDREVAETGAKFQAMLQALDLMVDESCVETMR